MVQSAVQAFYPLSIEVAGGITSNKISFKQQFVKVKILAKKQIKFRCAQSCL
jgi:hypothetical protein